MTSYNISKNIKIKNSFKKKILLTPSEVIKKFHGRIVVIPKKKKDQ